jgi:RNA polymerase sigma-70 factor, ECF subfamily
VSGLSGHGVPEADAKKEVRLASFDQYRSLLFSIAYRMLGSVADAEDILQDAFIRWQQSREEDIRSPRSFLVTIVSRLCINHLQSARVQREQYVGEWLPEPIVTDIGSDPLSMIKIDESLSMAFLLLLERLTPVERAVFLLREVFEYEYSEIASVLDLTEVNCRQILARARKHVASMRPRFGAPKKQQTELFQRFLEAVGTGSIDNLLELLAKDVALYSDGGGKAIAVPNIVRGSENVARGIIGGLKRLVPPDMERRLAMVNGKTGLINYRNGKPHSVLTFDIGKDQIRSIYIITNPDKLAHIQPAALSCSSCKHCRDLILCKYRNQRSLQK